MEKNSSHNTYPVDFILKCVISNRNCSKCRVFYDVRLAQSSDINIFDFLYVENYTHDCLIAFLSFLSKQQFSRFFYVLPSMRRVYV